MIRFDTVLEKYESVSIMAAWGETIRTREYFKKCLVDIFDSTKNKKINWLTIGFTQSGHPRHPSRAAYIGLTDFDIEKYLTALLK